LAVALWIAAGRALADGTSSPEFERIKSLAGEWKGTARGHGADQATPTAASIRVVSAGSAVMLVTDSGTPHEMVTMFHRADGALLAAHYCAAQNQPRMKARATKDPNKLTFEFVDGTNLREHPGRMQRLVLTMAEGGRHQQEWTFRDGAKTNTMVFDMEREK
jgi:hypothetical protein